MARLAFFATKNDYADIFDFLFATTDCRLYELASEFGQPLRKFGTADEAKAAIMPGRKRGEALPANLRLWIPKIMAKPIIHRDVLDPTHCEGHTFRYSFRGPGSAAFDFHGMGDGAIHYSEYTTFDEATAKARGYAKGVDWPAFKRISNKIEYHIRSRLAVARLPAIVVLPDALHWAKQGHILVRHGLLQWRFGPEGLERIVRTSDES